MEEKIRHIAKILFDKLNTHQDNKKYRLYYVEISTDKKPLFKIGVSKMNRLIDRFRADTNRITLKCVWDFESKADALVAEKNILNCFIDDKYDGSKVLKSGNSEIFNRDILEEIKIHCEAGTILEHMELFSDAEKQTKEIL